QAARPPCAPLPRRSGRSRSCAARDELVRPAAPRATPLSASTRRSQLRLEHLARLRTRTWLAHLRPPASLIPPRRGLGLRLLLRVVGPHPPRLLPDPLWNRAELCFKFRSQVTEKVVTYLSVDRFCDVPAESAGSRPGTYRFSQFFWHRHAHFPHS